MADLGYHCCQRSPRLGCKDCRRHRRGISDRRAGGLSRQPRTLTSSPTATARPLPCALPRALRFMLPRRASLLRFATAGPVTIGATLTAGVAYYLSGTPGGIRPVADNTTGDYPVILGIATSTTVLNVKIQEAGVASVMDAGQARPPGDAPASRRGRPTMVSSPLPAHSQTLPKCGRSSFPLTATERAQAGETQAYAQARYRIRKDTLWADLNAKDRLLDPDSRVFNIVNVTEPRRGYLFVECVSACRWLRLPISRD
jgi:hypothetical protein